jgi:hypothetical protein
LWEDEVERSFHGERPPHNLLGPWSRFVVFVNGDRIRAEQEATRENLETRVAALGWSSERRQRARALFEAPQRVFAASALIKLLLETRPARAQKRLEQLAPLFAAWARNLGRVPTDAELSAQAVISPDKLEDEYFGRVHLEEENGRGYLVSFGDDHQRGGSGEAADIRVLYFDPASSDGPP